MAGISAIILFIAFVLVAAVAAGLYIEYSGQLSSQAQNTGEESQAQVANQLYTLDAVGVVNNSSTNGSNVVETVHLNVRKAAGADDIDMKQASIRTVHEEGSAVLVFNSSGANSGLEFGVGTYKDDDGSLANAIVNSQSDRAKITLKFKNNSGTAGDELSPGEELTIQITEAAGGTTTTFFTVPTSLDDKEVGETILLS